MADDKRGEKGEKTFMDNPPACGAKNKTWPWGYLPCGCYNDGYGNHIR